MNTSSKYLTILLAVAALLLTSACSNDDMDAGVTTEFVSAQVTASINNGEAESRATNTTLLKAEFVEGDVAHVVPSNSSTYYDYTLSSGTWSSDNPYYFQNTDDVTFTAWYAYSSTGSESSIAINTANNQASDTTEWCKWDILVAPAVTANYKNPVVSFTGDYAFDHIMSKMTFKFIAGDGISNLSDLSGYSLSNLITEATFNTSDYSLTNGTTTSSISQTISGIANTETSYISAPLILVPQTFSEDNPISIAVTYNGNTYTADIPLTALVAGYHYAFNVTIGNTGLTIEDAEIKDWSSGGSTEGNFSYIYTTDDSGVRSYIVYDEAGLNAWADYVNSASSSSSSNLKANCTLANDITLTEVESGSSNWTPVGNSSNPYIGTFDGNGHTISNLTINDTNGNGKLGLIGNFGTFEEDDSGNNIYFGEVKNLTLTNVNITSEGNCIGAVAGFMQGGTITNCHVSGTFEGDGDVGGVVGDFMLGAVIACYSTGTVSGDNMVGGVAGEVEEGTLIACYSTATVSGTSYVGGVTGSNPMGTVTACYFAGSVTGTGANNEPIGGVVGYIEGGIVTACYWTNSNNGDYAATYGIGYDEESRSSSNTGATQVTGDVTWTSTALSAMNTALESEYEDAEGYTVTCDWRYVENTASSDPPLLLE